MNCPEMVAQAVIQEEQGRRTGGRDQFPFEGPSLTEYGNHSPLKHRRHPPKTPCARIHLESGTILIQHAPDLFCTPEELAQMLLLEVRHCSA